MRNYFVAVQVEEGGKFYAYVVKVSDADNLVSKLAIKDIKVASICKSKKEAEGLVNRWNAIHKANNSYMFDLPVF